MRAFAVLHLQIEAPGKQLVSIVLTGALPLEGERRLSPLAFIVGRQLRLNEVLIVNFAGAGISRGNKMAHRNLLLVLHRINNN